MIGNTIIEAGAHLSALMESVLNGKELQRTPCGLKGKIRIDDDFVSFSV